MILDDWQAFGVELVRGAQVQHVRYFTWDGEGPNNPDADKIEWKQTSVALQPLVE